MVSAHFHGVNVNSPNIARCLNKQSWEEMPTLTSQSLLALAPTARTLQDIRKSRCSGKSLGTHPNCDDLISLELLCARVSRSSSPWAHPESEGFCVVDSVPGPGAETNMRTSWHLLWAICLPVPPFPPLRWANDYTPQAYGGQGERCELSALRGVGLGS